MAQPRLFGFEVTKAEYACYHLANIYIEKLKIIMDGGISVHDLLTSGSMSAVNEEMKKSRDLALEVQELISIMESEFNDALLDKMKDSQFRQVSSLYTRLVDNYNIREEVNNLPHELKNKTVWRIFVDEILSVSLDSLIPLFSEDIKSLEGVIESIKKLSK